MSSRHGSRPRPEFGRDREFYLFDRKENRKARQLCRQVHRALMYVVPGDMADPLLQELSVKAVYPAPDASRLLVTFTTTRHISERQQIVERIERLRPRLRAEVAAAICRKRAPELTFQLSFASEVNP